MALLDALRLVAAVMVMCWHYVGQGDRSWGRDSREMFPVLDGVTSYGWLGVQLFFVISGFVVCMSAWGRSAGDFAVSRMVRLYPAYWFAVIFTTAVTLLAGTSQESPNLVDFLINLTMLQAPMGVRATSDVYWTLWVELHFYLLFTLVVWRGLTYRRVMAFCTLWTIAAVCSNQLDNPQVDLLVGGNYAPLFIAGIVLYLMHRFRPTFLLWGLLGMSWILSMPATGATTQVNSGFGNRELNEMVTQSVVACAILVVAVVVLVPRLSRIHARTLSIAGAMTYPLYLLHLDTGWLAIDRLHHRVPVGVLLGGLTAGMLLFSWLVHRFIERPVARRMKALLVAGLSDLRNSEAVEGRRSTTEPACPPEIPRPRSDPPDDRAMALSAAPGVPEGRGAETAGR